MTVLRERTWWPVTAKSKVSDLRFTPIAALPKLARGATLASLRRLALGANRRVIPLALTSDLAVTGH
jgi:hypothetical protein